MMPERYGELRELAMTRGRRMSDAGAREAFVVGLQECLDENERLKAEVERLTAENASLWSVLVQPCCGRWLACETASKFFDDESEAKEFVREQFTNAKTGPPPR